MTVQDHGVGESDKEENSDEAGNADVLEKSEVPGETDEPSDIRSIREEHGAIDSRDSREDRAPAGSEACLYTSYEDGDVSGEYPKTGAGSEGVARDVWDALFEVEDPEMPVSVVDLGLIYDVHVEGDGDDNGETLADTDHNAKGETVADTDGGVTVRIEMTLTYTGCPARDILTNDVRCVAETVPEVTGADVQLRYSPEWNVNMVTDQGRADLREFGLSV